MAGGRLADAAASLTMRGRCLVAAGLTLGVLGMLLGERSLVRLAVFVLALPALSAVTVARQRFRLASRRTVTPPRLPRGGEADVLLEVSNTDRRTGGLWVLTEQLPPELGARPRFVVDGLAGGATAALRYRLHGGRRGRFALGPLRLRLVDPFGLVRRTVAGSDTAALLVVPRVRPLQGGPALTGTGGEGGAGGRQSLAVHGEDDVSTREYRHGDDLRLVHWRATARTGELMVRQEERPSRASATLFLDTRARAHLLGGRVTAPATDPAAPTDTLEWVVEAAASIGVHLLERGAALRVVTDAGELLPPGGRGRLTPTDLLEQLAALTPSRATGLQVGAEALRRTGEGPVICLLGTADPEAVAALARTRSGPARDVAVLVDPVGWLEAGANRDRRSLNGAARAGLAARTEATAGALRAAGWQVVAARPEQPVEQVWALLGTPTGSSPAGSPLTGPAGAATRTPRVPA